MWLGITEALIIFIITATITGGWTFICRARSDAKAEKERREEHHKQMDDLPELFKRHEELHKQIAEELEQGRQTDIASMRTQLVQLHDYIMKHPDALFFKEQFYELYKVYEIRGGNSFAPKLKKDIDNLK